MGLESDLYLEQIINQKSLLFTSFNKRYLSLLPIAINAIMILKKSNQIKLTDKIIEFNNINFSPNINLGDRMHKIISVIPLFLSLTNRYTTLQLYQILNIQL